MWLNFTRLLAVVGSVMGQIVGNWHSWPVVILVLVHAQWVGWDFDFLILWIIKFVKLSCLNFVWGCTKSCFQNYLKPDYSFIRPLVWIANYPWIFCVLSTFMESHSHFSAAANYTVTGQTTTQLHSCHAGNYYRAAIFNCASNWDC